MPEAAEVFKAASEKAPDVSYFQNCIGQIMGRLDKFDEALAAFEKAEVADPEDEYAKNGKAASLAKLGRLDEALAAFEDRIRLNKDDPFAWDGKSFVLKTMGRKEESDKAKSEAIRLFRILDSNDHGTFSSKIDRYLFEKGNAKNFKCPAFFCVTFFRKKVTL